ncbi:MAG: L-2-amino-thiazoline-4-carboxylic acid hydrolase [Clostridia bacterium]|nr:L-2-amino-thiazoline-4-carboxylic acid hydrolase [Clostridia bacterium]
MIIEIEKTFFKHFFDFLSGKEPTVSIREEADVYIYDLAECLSRYQKRSTKRFLKNNLLPAIAVFKALSDTWLTQERILSLMKAYLEQYAAGTLSFYHFKGKVGKLTGSYQNAVYAEMKKREEGWDKIWLYNAPKESACNVTKCFIYEVCKEFECPALTVLFCDYEKELFQRMNGGKGFACNHAIGRGDEFCDFVFEE